MHFQIEANTLDGEAAQLRHPHPGIEQDPNHRGVAQRGDVPASAHLQQRGQLVVA